jgi:hypothetical protein
MTVRKYRSVEEIPGVPPREPLVAENLRIACELAYALRPASPARPKDNEARLNLLEKSRVPWCQTGEHVRRSASRRASISVRKKWLDSDCTTATKA